MDKKSHSVLKSDNNICYPLPSVILLVTPFHPHPAPGGVSEAIDQTNGKVLDACNPARTDRGGILTIAPPTHDCLPYLTLVALSMRSGEGVKEGGWYQNKPWYWHIPE